MYTFVDVHLGRKVVLELSRTCFQWPIGNEVAKPRRTHSTKSLTAVEQVSCRLEKKPPSWSSLSNSNYHLSNSKALPRADGPLSNSNCLFRTRTVLFRTRTVCSKKLYTFVDVHLGRKVEYTLANVLNMLPMADWQRSCQILSYAFYEIPYGCRAGFIPFGKKATIKPARHNRKRATRAALGRPFEFERRPFEFETLNGLLSNSNCPDHPRRTRSINPSRPSSGFYCVWKGRASWVYLVPRAALVAYRSSSKRVPFEFERVPVEFEKSTVRVRKEYRSSSKEYRSSSKRVPFKFERVPFKFERVPFKFEKSTVQVRKKPMIAAFSQT